MNQYRGTYLEMKIILSRDAHDVLEYTLNKGKVKSKFLSKESSLIVLFKSAFLPIGFPLTVSKDYVNYQFYDTLQAFCSSLIGMLATRSILQGFGVGDSNSSVLSALLTWTLRDGVAMLSRIVFAYIYSNKFSSELKSWRYTADFLNNIGYALDFFAASFTDKTVFTVLASCSVVFKTMTAVAGGATKTALTNHFAINGNTADLDAKDGSQETLVNLVGMIVGSYFIQLVPLENFWIWSIFLLFGSLHLYFNFLAISSVILKTVNRQRARILLDHFIETGLISSPDQVAEKERLFFYKDHIYIGSSIHALESKDLEFLIKSQDTVMIKRNNARYIYVHRDSSPERILKSYLTAVLDQSDRPTKTSVLDKFLTELSQSSWKFNVSDLDLLGYQYYIPS